MLHTLGPAGPRVCDICRYTAAEEGNCDGGTPRSCGPDVALLPCHSVVRPSLLPARYPHATRTLTARFCEVGVRVTCPKVASSRDELPIMTCRNTHGGWLGIKRRLKLSGEMRGPGAAPDHGERSRPSGQDPSALE